jgi:hypothetical protein
MYLLLEYHVFELFDKFYVSIIFKVQIRNSNFSFDCIIFNCECLNYTKLNYTKLNHLHILDKFILLSYIITYI